MRSAPYARTVPLPRRASLVLALGALLLVVGAALLVVAATVDVGWFAYAPESQAVLAPGVWLRPRQVWGAGLVVAGLVVVSGAVGFLVGRRPGR